MISSAGMAGGLYILEPLVAIDDSQAGSLWKLCLLIPAGVLIKFFLLLAFGFPEAGSAARKIRVFCGKLFA